MSNTRKIFRIEVPNGKNGMWYNEHGELEKTIHILCPNAIAKDFPMDYNPIHRKDGKVWQSAAKNVENMNQWFSREDAESLVSHGFKLIEFEVNEWNELDMEILFTREGVVSQREIPIDDVW